MHAPRQDVDQYGREADRVIDVDLQEESATDSAANNILSDEDAKWSPLDSCADAVESILNEGGLETDHNDAINTSQNLKNEITNPEPTKAAKCSRDVNMKKGDSAKFFLW